ncbi:pectin lyase-like protein [Lojkania enalia]|uniref:Pectin lyase-like protein n=1 Tax=Lojkania enalia TaxID=147567 RepID=A0A9P4N7C7_9PLEO|nr:pectin lyase-like protein [Didymosphaeria enalia]
MKPLSLLNLACLFVISRGLESKAQSTQCIPESGNSSLIDDSPVIGAALEACGEGGSVLIPAGRTYYILSTIDFSPCKSCELQLDGTLNISSNSTLWRGQPAIFQFPSVHDAKIYSASGSGLITSNSPGAQPVVPVFNIISSSSSLVFTNLHIQNPIGTVFEIDDFSSDLEFQALTLDWSDVSRKAPYASRLQGFSVTNSSSITIANTRIANMDSCIILQNGVSHVSAENISCSANRGGAWFDPELQRYDFEQTAFDIMFRRVDIADADIATGVRTGNKGSFMARNVTWENVKVRNVGAWAEITSCIGGPRECGSVYGTSLDLELVFRGVEGSARRLEGPRCVNSAVTKHESLAHFLLVTPRAISRAAKLTKLVIADVAPKTHTAYFWKMAFRNLYLPGGIWGFLYLAVEGLEKVSVISSPCCLLYPSPDNPLNSETGPPSLQDQTKYETIKLKTRYEKQVDGHTQAYKRYGQGQFYVYNG